MKKKTLILISLLFAASCSEVCDHFDIPDPPVDKWSPVGTWYEETKNEEIRYYASGTMYDKYCNKTAARETEGRYEFDYENWRLTYVYSFLGQNIYDDFKVSDVKDYSFTIYSDKVGRFSLEKIVESISLEAGESKELTFFSEHPELKLLSAETNSRIVSVNSNVITACGEKGTAYIKLNTDNGIMWAKAVVGDDCADLWYDYVSFIGCDYSYMKSELGSPSINGSDGYSFGYTMDYHDYLKEVDFFFNSSTGLLEHIGLALVDGAPAAEVEAYMKAHYYPMIDMDGFYTSSSSLEESIAMLMYSKSSNVVYIVDASYYVFPDCSKYLGNALAEIISEFGESQFGSSFLLYKLNNLYGGSVYFEVSETTGKVVLASLGLLSSIKPQVVHNTLSEKYNCYMVDETIGKYAYRNAGESDSTIRVIYDSQNATVTWFDLLNYGK